MIREYHSQLAERYNSEYNEVLKPLLAVVEAAYEKCIEDNLDKSYGHLKRAILDCLKYMNVWYHEFFERFEKKHRKVDLTTINSGEFLSEYAAKRQAAIIAIRQAKKMESIDCEKAFDLYQDGYTAYQDLEDYVFSNLRHLRWATHRFYCNKGITFCIWLATLIAGAVIGVIITAVSSPFSDWIKGLFAAAE